jgi:hypothetical protein
LLQNIPKYLGPGLILCHNLSNGKKDMRFGTWNVRSFCRVGAIKSVVRELEKYKLDLVGVQEIKWEGEGYQTAGTIHFSIENGMLVIT